MLIQIERYENEDDERIITYYHTATIEDLDAYVITLRLEDNRKVEVFRINEDTFKKIKNGFHKKYEEPIEIKKIIGEELIKLIGAHELL